MSGGQHRPGRHREERVELDKKRKAILEHRNNRKAVIKPGKRMTPMSHDKLR